MIKPIILLLNFSTNKYILNLAKPLIQYGKLPASLRVLLFGVSRPRTVRRAKGRSQSPNNRTLRLAGSNIRNWLKLLTKYTKTLLFYYCIIIACSTPTLAIDTLNLDFHDIKTKDLLQLLNRFAEKNIITHDNIKDTISIKLHTVTWREALDAILAIKDLGKYEDQAIIFVAPGEELTKYEKQKQTSLPLDTKVLKINNTTATSIVDILTKQPGLLSSTGTIYADSHTNNVIIVDNPHNITTINKLIKAIDIAPKKLLITARIVNIDNAHLSELGIKFGTTKSNNASSRNNQHNGFMTTNDYSHFDFNIAKLGSSMLDLELTALENKGHAKIISAPKLLTTNNKPAHIESGAEIPYQEKTVSGATNVAFKKAVLSLEVIPEIIGTEQIHLQLKLNQDKVSRLTIQGVPAIDTRKIHTEIIVNNGDTIVLGGIYEWITTNNTMQQPVLGNIPYLGALFRNAENQTKRTELLIFVTTKILPN